MSKDHLVLVFSDIEMGFGGPEDDFSHSNFLKEILERYALDEYANTDIDLVFNGDTFAVC